MTFLYVFLVLYALVGLACVATSWFDPENKFYPAYLWWPAAVIVFLFWPIVLVWIAFAWVWWGVLFPPRQDD